MTDDEILAKRREYAQAVRDAFDPAVIAHLIEKGIRFIDSAPPEFQASRKAIQARRKLMKAERRVKEAMERRAKEGKNERK